MHGETFWDAADLEALRRKELNDKKIDKGEVDYEITGRVFHPLTDECEDWDEECRKRLHGVKRK